MKTLSAFEQVELQAAYERLKDENASLKAQIVELKLQCQQNHSDTPALGEGVSSLKGK